MLRSKKWEETKRKGRCQCYACDECEGQRQNYRYHGSPPFPAMRRLPQQGKDIRDRHHSLVLLIGGPLVARRKKGRPEMHGPEDRTAPTEH